jgi:hypothetical protein
MGASIPLASAAAQDSSPYVVGHWRLNDSFRDFKPGAPITTTNTDFVFLNPTGFTLTLEYAFFAAINATTTREMNALHKLCVGFIGH